MSFGQKNSIKQSQRAAAKNEKKEKAVAGHEADDVAIDPITGDYDYEYTFVHHGVCVCG